MRYTTIIDIREQTSVYKNPLVRLVYLHLVLLAGYHDEDRDFVSISYRQLADQVGITLSATRHAVAILCKYGLLESIEGVWRVKKWLPAESITPRPKSAQKAKEQETAAIRQEEQRALDERLEAERRQAEADQAAGTNSLYKYLDSLEQRAAMGDDEAARTLQKPYYKSIQEKRKNGRNNSD